MRFLLIIAGALISPVMLINCSPIGLAYHNVKSPPANMSLTQISGERMALKTGQACAKSVLGLVAWGDAGQEAAAKNGNIVKIHSADESRNSILGFFYRKNCTVVMGE